MSGYTNELWIRLTQIGRSFDCLMDYIIKDKNITKKQLLALFFIYSYEHPNINDLKNKLMCNQGNISSLCKKMEEMELIKKVKNKGDERIVNLLLLPKGEKIIRNIQNKFNKHEEILSRNEKDKMDSIILGLSNLNEFANDILTSMKGVQNVRDKKD